MNFLKDAKGVTMIEGALIARLISVATITLMSVIGVTLTNVYQTIADALTVAEAP